MTGLRARIGERRRQDAAISISLMLEMQKKLEAKWTRAFESKDTLEMRCVAETGSFFILTYCGSLRGFETPKVVLSDLKKQTLSPEESQENANRGNLVPPHVSLPLQGRFKARSQEMQKRIIDIAWETCSGLQPGIWTLRLIHALEALGVTTGWAYQREGRQMRMSEFSEEFFELLLEIQKDRPDLIASDIDVLEAFGMARSARRGATTRAQAANVSQDIIDWMNRWNIGENDVVHGPMRVVYSERKQMLVKFLEFSLAL